MLFSSENIIFFKYEYRKITSWHSKITSKSCRFCCFICFSSENNIFSSTSKQREFPKTFFCDNKNWNCPKKLSDIFLLVSMEHVFDFKNQLKHEWTVKGLPNVFLNVFFVLLSSLERFFQLVWLLFFAILTTRHKSQNRTDAKNVKRQNVERHFVENTI